MSDTSQESIYLWTKYAANKKLILFAHNNTGNLIPS